MSQSKRISKIRKFTLTMSFLFIFSTQQLQAKVDLQLETGKHWLNTELKDQPGHQASIWHTGARAHFGLSSWVPMNIGIHVFQGFDSGSSFEEFSQLQYGMESQFWLKHDLYSLYPIATIGYGKIKTSFKYLDSDHKMTGPYVSLGLGVKWQSPIRALSGILSYEFQQVHQEGKSSHKQLKSWQSYRSNKVLAGIAVSW